mgnify:CR=1 FL=1
MKINRSQIKNPAVVVPQAHFTIGKGGEYQNTEGEAVTTNAVAQHDFDISLYFKEGDDYFLRLNPRFFLYRYKPNNKTTDTNGTNRSGRAWVHPSNENSLNGCMYHQGEHHDTGGNLITPVRTTEWVINTQEYKTTTATIKTSDWVKTVDPITNIMGYNNVPFPIEEEDWGQNPPISFSGNGRSASQYRNNKRLLFRFAVAVENPKFNKETKRDICDETKSAHPYIVGPMSEILVIEPKMGEFGDVDNPNHLENVAFDKFYTWRARHGRTMVG